jgi:hypothetical protein
MRLLAARENEEPPSADTLSAYYARHAADYRMPERVSLWHLFLSRPAPGAAEELLAALGAEDVPPAIAVRRGDTFFVPPYLRAQSPDDLARSFGADFAARLADAPVGVWSGPISSPYGLHLVWVERRTPAETPPLEAVGGRLRERWLGEQRDRRVRNTLCALRARHRLEIDSQAWRDRSRS